jgi:predicted dithiol-disulfide oxidoreductase (DUF899 family)
MKTLDRQRAARRFRASGFDYDPAYEAMLAQDREIARDCERGPDARPGTPWQQILQSIQQEAERR